MAEASFQVYIIVMFVFGILGLTLSTLRRNRLGILPRTRNISSWFIVGIFVIFISSYFIIGGSTIIQFSTILNEDIKTRPANVEINSKIIFRDPDIQRSWINDIEIANTEDNPLVIGTEKRLHVVVTSKELPQAMVVHIYPEDLRGFFTNDDDPDGFRTVTEKLNRIPTLQYGPIFHIVFDLSESPSCDHDVPSDCTYTFNAFGNGKFTMKGKYYAHFSIKDQHGKFEHKETNYYFTEISDPSELKFEKYLADLTHKTDLQKVDDTRSLGVAYLGIGIGMLFSGLTIIQTSTRRL